MGSEEVMNGLAEEAPSCLGVTPGVGRIPSVEQQIEGYIGCNYYI